MTIVAIPCICLCCSFLLFSRPYLHILKLEILKVVSGGHKVQINIWNALMANKFIIAKYIQDKDEKGFYDEMIYDRETAKFLKECNIAEALFRNEDETLVELEHLTDLGYIKKSINEEVNRIKYRYVKLSSLDYKRQE